MKKLLYGLTFSACLHSVDTQQSLTLLAESLEHLATASTKSLKSLQQLPYATFFINSSTIKINKTNPLENILTNGFIQDCTQYFSENGKIPPVENKFRVATYNVHAWMGPELATLNPRRFKENTAGILQTIHALQATVLILEEAHGKIVNTTSKLELAFLEKGYRDYVWCEGANYSGASFGNVILTKFIPEYKHSQQYTVPHAGIAEAKNPKNPHEKRCFDVVRTTHAPTGTTLAIYGTHLDVWDETGAIRDKELQELLNFIQADSSDVIIVGGDFNAFREQDYNQTVWQKILDNTASHLKITTNKLPTKTLDVFKIAGFKDSFAFSGQKGPKFTVWTGTVVDFLFIKDKRTDAQKKAHRLKTQSYVYYSAASDHIPVILDLEIK